MPISLPFYCKLKARFFQELNSRVEVRSIFPYENITKGKKRAQTTKKPKQKFGPLLFSVEFVLVYKHSDVTSSLWFHSVELIFEYTGNKLRYCKSLENYVHSSLFLFNGESCVGM